MQMQEYNKLFLIVHILTFLLSITVCTSIAIYQHPLVLTLTIILLPCSYSISWVLRNKKFSYKTQIATALALLGIPIVGYFSPFVASNYRFWFGNYIVWLIVTMSMILENRKDYLWILLMCVILSSLITTVRLVNSFPLLFIILTLLSVSILFLLTLIGQETESQKKSIRESRFHSISWSRYYLNVSYFTIVIILSSMLITSLLPRYSLFGPRNDTQSSKPSRVRQTPLPNLNNQSSDENLLPYDEEIINEGQGNPFFNWIRHMLVRVEMLNSRASIRDSVGGFTEKIDLAIPGEDSQDNTLAVVIRSDYATYSRAMVYDSYNGKSWFRSKINYVRLRSSNGYFEQELFRYIYGSLQKTLTKPQGRMIYNIRTELNSSIPMPYFPSVIRYPDQFLFIDYEATFQSPFILSEGTIYTIEPSVPQYDERQIHILSTIVNSTTNPEYLALPALPNRVKKLAQDLTDTKPNQLAKVNSIKDYLAKNNTYVKTYPALPSGYDFVDNFLFETNQGNCQHFASAMAVLCRAVGIPSRLVSGFTPGTYNPVTDSYEIRVSDAHAWVEIYYQGYGWKPYDATPSAPLFVKPLNRKELLNNLFTYLQVRWMGTVNGPLTNIITPINQVIQNFIAFIKQTGKSLAGMSLQGIFNILLIILISTFTIILGYRKLKGFVQNRKYINVYNKKSSYSSDACRLFNLYENFCLFLGGKGFPKSPSMTPHEYLNYLHSQEITNPSIVKDLTEWFCKIRYGNHSMDKSIIGNLEYQFKIFKKEFRKTTYS